MNNSYKIQENVKLAPFSSTENSNLAEVSPLISVPIQNRKNLFRIKNASLQSLVDHDLITKRFFQAKKQGYKDRSGSSIYNTTKIIDYIQINQLVNNSSLLREQILDIKNNNNKYQSFKVKADSTELNTELNIYLEDIIFLLLLLFFFDKKSKNNKDKVFIRKLLKKLNLQNNIRHTTRFNHKTPISLELKGVFLNYLQNLKQNFSLINPLPASQQNETTKIAAQKSLIAKLSQFQPFIEYNFKVKNIGPIQIYKDINSTGYKSLSKQDKKIIGILNIIDSISLSEGSKSGNFQPYINSNILNIPTASSTPSCFPKDAVATKQIASLLSNKEEKAITKSNNKSNIENTDNIESKLIEKVSLNSNSIMPKRKFLRYISPFNSDLSYSKNHMYNFNKKNDYNLFKNEKNIYHILEAAFLKMDSLISKAFFSVTPNNVSIHLFFYWKPLYFLFNKKSKNTNLLNQFSNKFKSDQSTAFFSFKERVQPKDGGNQIKNLKNKFFYSKNFSKFAIIFEKNLKILSYILTNLLKKPVNFHFTRIYYPYNDSNIFASLIGFMSFFLKFRFISKQIIKKIIFRIRKRRLHRLKFRVIPAVVTGINIKLAGRILTARTKRKVKSRTVQWGSLARSKNNIKFYSKFTNKNKMGAFSINIKDNNFILK